jgi:hypothetical protein
MLHNAGMQPFGTSWDFWDRIARPEIRRAIDNGCRSRGPAGRIKTYSYGDPSAAAPAFTREQMRPGGGIGSR